MRKSIFVLFLFSTILNVTCCFATTNVINPNSHRSHNSYRAFLVDYCEETNQYWMAVNAPLVLFGEPMDLPPLFHIYHLNQDFSAIERVHSTVNRIHALLPTKNGLFYREQKFLHPMATDITFYDTQTNRHQQALKIYPSVFYAYSNDLLYYCKGVNDVYHDHLCVYDMNTKQNKALLKYDDILGYDCSNFYYVDDNGIQMYLDFSTQKSYPFYMPGGVSHIYKGYMLNEVDGILYNSKQEKISVPFVKDAYTVVLSDQYICALIVEEEGCMLRYAKTETPNVVIEVNILSHVYNANVNLCNNKVFFYTKLNQEITCIDLETGTLQVITF